MNCPIYIALIWGSDLTFTSNGNLRIRVICSPDECVVIILVSVHLSCNYREASAHITA